ncbi:ribosomal-protein-alanine N-acetyltransferase [Caldicoprobacter guelmensis]|uniref:ribosomal protein S18-alanine N-acetyltransferase n=1 Tax=Caldicoprobacter guelmensis TaxID=1170224 RepID=UPI00311CA44A|nr:ribosomal-protein-alanine N-acetyltransferase [Caldicoprobacter guelmensis]
MDYVVRPIKSDDVDAVWEIEKMCFSVPWSRQSFVLEVEKNKCARYVVAEQDGNVLGYAGMWLIVDEAHVTNIAVHPLFRRKGIGQALLKALMMEAYRMGIDKMTLEVRASNIAAQSLYKKLGFVEVGVRKGYYSDNDEDAVIMWNFSISRALGLKQGE